MAKYLVEIFWSEKDGGYIAVVPDLPGCSAFGETLEEAAREIEDAQVAWIEACHNSGDPLPEPAARALEGDAATANAPSRFPLRWHPPEKSIRLGGRSWVGRSGGGLLADSSYPEDEKAILDYWWNTRSLRLKAVYYVGFGFVNRGHDRKIAKNIITGGMEVIRALDGGNIARAEKFIDAAEIWLGRLEQVVLAHGLSKVQGKCKPGLDAMIADRRNQADQNKRRDQHIVAAYRSGTPVELLMTEYKLSRTRVYEIIARAKK